MKAFWAGWFPCASLAGDAVKVGGNLSAKPVMKPATRAINAAAPSRTTTRRLPTLGLRWASTLFANITAWRWLVNEQIFAQCLAVSRTASVLRLGRSGLAQQPPVTLDQARLRHVREPDPLVAAPVDQVDDGAVSEIAAGRTDRDSVAIPNSPQLRARPVEPVEGFSEAVRGGKAGDGGGRVCLGPHADDYHRERHPSAQVRLHGAEKACLERAEVEALSVEECEGHDPSSNLRKRDRGALLI